MGLLLMRFSTQRLLPIEIDVFLFPFSFCFKDTSPSSLPFSLSMVYSHLIPFFLLPFFAS
jgi:hypothetical protein